MTTAVVVTYNSAHCLATCLEALRDAGIEDVVVVDNASTDGTRSVAAGHPVEVLALPGNLGFGRAVNAGAALRPGADLLLVNPDTVVGAEAVRACLDRLARDDGVAVVGCRLEQGDGEVDPACLRRVPTPLSSACYLLRRLPVVGRWSSYHPPAADYRRDADDVEAINGAFMLVRRARFDAVGGFDERYFMYGEDLDLCVRMRADGSRIAYLGSQVAFHAKGRSSDASARRTGPAKVAFEDAMRLFFDAHQAPTAGRLRRSVVRLALHLRARAALTAEEYGAYRRRITGVPGMPA
jgi:GT2 family glycosyltransferase